MTIGKKKKMNMESKEKETKCCGNCYYFKDENIDGTGHCHLFRGLYFYRDDGCEDWEGKEDAQ